MPRYACYRRLLAGVLLALLAPLAAATVLPEERADVLYHRYDGGGVTVDGTSVLVRKNIANTVSINANYYVDHVSSASIDVVTQASPMGYTEQRVQKSVGVDYLYGSSLMSAGYIKSDESDYHANTYTFDISQDFFGDLTNLTAGFSYGSDTVLKNRDPSFKADVRRYQYRVGVSQVVTPNLLLAFSWENIADDGYLKSPYRSDYYLNTVTDARIAEPDSYPQTHDSDAFALRALYYLPYRAALKGEYKYYTDDWGITANSLDIGYTHPLAGTPWMFDVHARYYQQGKAYFYSDLFAYADAQNYRARDKELSTFHAKTLGLGVSYQFGNQGFTFFDKGSVNFAWDHIRFDYQDFRDVRVHTTPGTEPLYSFDADVIRFFISVWY